MNIPSQVALSWWGRNPFYANMFIEKRKKYCILSYLKFGYTVTMDNLFSIEIIAELMAFLDSMS